MKYVNLVEQSLNTTKSSGVLIVSDGKFLRVHVSRKPDKSNMWGIPKGAIDGGETSEVAALREVLEETGLNLRKEKGKLSSIGSAKYKPFNGTQKILDGWLFIADEDLTKKKLVCKSMVTVDGDSFPEVDKFVWTDLNKKGTMHYTSEDILRQAQKKIN